MGNQQIAQPGEHLSDKAARVMVCLHLVGIWRDLGAVHEDIAKYSPAFSPEICRSLARVSGDLMELIEEVAGEIGKGFSSTNPVKPGDGE